MIGTQLYLVVSGTYAWLNWLTTVAIVAALLDQVITAVLSPFAFWTAGAAFAETPDWFTAAVLALAAVVVVLSCRPVRNTQMSGRPRDRTEAVAIQARVLACRDRLRRHEPPGDAARNPLVRLAKT